MNATVIFFFMILLAGCTYKGQDLETYIDQPETILRDPHYASYQEQSDDLEKQYLDKKMTYADYLEKKKTLDDKYSKEVKQREEIISPEPNP